MIWGNITHLPKCQIYIRYLLPLSTSIGRSIGSAIGPLINILPAIQLANQREKFSSFALIETFTSLNCVACPAGIAAAVAAGLAVGVIS